MIFIFTFTAGIQPRAGTFISMKYCYLETVKSRTLGKNVELNRTPSRLRFENSPICVLEPGLFGADTDDVLLCDITYIFFILISGHSGVVILFLDSLSLNYNKILEYIIER